MRQSAQQMFLENFPGARVEGHTGNDRKRYFLIRRKKPGGDWEYMPCGEGDTKAQAWRDACERARLIKEK